MRYYMIPLAQPRTPYLIEPRDGGFTVRHVEHPHPMSWRETRLPVVYPTRERAEARVRTACNPASAANDKPADKPADNGADTGTAWYSAECDTCGDLSNSDPDLPCGRCDDDEDPDADPCAGTYRAAAG